MATNKIGKLSDAKKVVFTKTQKSQGSGGGGPSNPIPDDVEEVNLGKVDEEEGKEKEGEEKDGKEAGKNKGEGKGKDKGEKGKGESGESGGDEESESSSDEGGDQDSKDKDGQEKGKGKGKKGKEGEEGDDKGEDDGGTRGDLESKDIDKIKKQAEELYEKIKNSDPLHQQCGSVDKRNEKQNKEGEDKDLFNEQEKFNRERIQAIIDEAVASGKDHPLKSSGGANRGTEKGGGGPKGELITIPMRKPEFLRKMKQFAESEYEKQYYKKGTDWLYTQSYGDIVFKDRPKVALPRKAVYILVDVSGSMFGDFDGTGRSLLEHLIGYLPTIAEDFVGEVWWMSSGILKWSSGPDKGKEARTPLSYFKGKKGLELTKFYEQVTSARGAGGGTVFNEEFQAIQFIREREEHNVPIIALTDGFIDDCAVEYVWPVKSKNKITGKLPPNTYMMTDPAGVDYLKRYYNEDSKTGFFSVSKNIQYFDVTENGKYKSLSS